MIRGKKRSQRTGINRRRIGASVFLFPPLTLSPSLLYSPSHPPHPPLRLHPLPISSDVTVTMIIHFQLLVFSLIMILLSPFSLLKKPEHLASSRHLFIHSSFTPSPFHWSSQLFLSSPFNTFTRAEKRRWAAKKELFFCTLFILFVSPQSSNHSKEQDCG